VTRRGIIIIAVLGIALAGAAAYRFRGAEVADAKTGQGRQAAALPVTTTTARSEDFAIQRRTIGVLESPATVVVKSRIESQVLEQHVKDGQLVHRGALLFTLDDREVKAAIARDEAQIAKDQATADRTEVDLQRYQRLSQSNAAPQQQLDQANADHKIALATVEADQAQLRADTVRLNYTKIEAPIGGRVGAIRVTPGNLISVNDAEGLVTITQIRPIRVNFTLAERDLAALRKAALTTPPATVKLYSPGASTPLATGTLDFVDSAVDTASGTIAAKGKFANENYELWPGMYVDVEIKLDTRPNTVMIPTVAIQSGQKGPFVFVVKQDGTAEIRNIELLGIEGDQAALVSGVKDGDAVIVEGQMRLTEGARVVASAGAGGKGAAAKAPAGSEASR
jgi:multidrug efflux system membrane fusion protein